MENLDQHYARILGLDEGWRVKTVNLKLENKTVWIYLEHKAKKGCCSKCSKEAPIYDLSPERSWRHLDTMQCTTMLKAPVPRVSCEEHGVTSAALPWSGRHSRFTLLFEAFAVEMLLAAKSISDACRMLDLHWNQAQVIMKRAVERGLERRDEQEIAWLGMDEKSFRKGHNYISVLNDIEGRRVLDVVEGRDGKVAEELIKQALSEKQREMVCGVSIDMSAPYIGAIHRNLPHADIVHDKYHISAHLCEGVDKTRRREHKQLMKGGENLLKGKKYQFLTKAEEGMTEEEFTYSQGFGLRELEVSKAWWLKELFNHFWTRPGKDAAKAYFTYWVKEVIESGNKEMLKVAAMIEKHLANILTYFDSYITNAISEGMNSKIQSLKSAARGFRSFANYRTTILFYCGKLNLVP